MAVEFVVAAPAFALLLLLISAAGQWVSATGQVGGAARDAARAASLARSPAEAALRAQTAASQDLAGLCGSPSVTIAPRAGGQPASFATAQDVRVTVECNVGLAAFQLVGFPASETFSAVAVAPLDSFVCRSGAC
jgi:Flp pilus assembly protein TadG